MSREVNTLDERERRQVIDAVNGLVRAQRDTGIGAKAIDRILASHRKSAKRQDARLRNDS